jgi:hypothetical protein
VSYIRYLCLFTYSGAQYILCCVFCFIFLRLVYPMLPVSLNCKTIQRNWQHKSTQDEEKQSRETGNIGYTRRRKTIQRYWQHRVHNPEKLATYCFSSSCVPMLPVSLDCFSSSCVLYVASFSGLFFFVLCTLCCQFLWIVFLRLVYPMRNWQHKVHKTKKNNPEKLAT